MSKQLFPIYLPSSWFRSKLVTVIPAPIIFRDAMNDLLLAKR